MLQQQQQQPFILPSKITNTNTIINNISKYLEGTGTWNNHKAN